MGASEQNPPTRLPGARWVSVLFPWVSLAVGVVGAVWMDRGPRQSALVASAAVLTWVTLLLLRWLTRVSPVDAGRRSRFVLAALSFSSLAATQSLLHLTIWFSLPFYFRAATFDEPGHVLFLLLLCALSLVSLWDPLSGWLLRRRLLAASLPMAASFVSLCAVLPGLGLSTQMALWVSLATACLCTLLFAALGSTAAERSAVLWRALAAIVCVCIAFALGAARIVPAAPLRLVKAEIGTRLSGKWVADPREQLAAPTPRLFCATAIWSPLGVRDALYHVWRKDGEERTRIKLRIAGGRDAGYRTYSRISPGRQSGIFRCSVETESGQVLGSAQVRLGAR